MKNVILFIVSILAFANFAAAQQQPQSDEARAMQKAGLTNVQNLDSTIVVLLKYATADNFMHTNVYGNLRQAYLQPDAARKLAKAQKILKSKYPSYSIIVYDAARPRSVQQKMWDVVGKTPNKRYVTSPGRISMHSYGVAVDVSIVDPNGKEIDMGTHFDEFDEKSQPRNEQRFLQSGKLTKQQIANRNILRNAMRQAGYHSIQNEWWHFQSISREAAQKQLKPID